MAEGLRGDDAIFSWFRSNSYNSQTSDHIDAVAEILLDDLVSTSDIIADAAEGGGLVFTRNYSLNGPSFLDEIDLVVGPPAESGQQKLSGQVPEIPEGDAGDVWLAIDFESLMSSIENNWKNRAQDIHSFYLSVYEHYPTAVTGAIVLYNVTALDTWEPDRLVSLFSEFDLAGGSLAKQLDSLLILPFDDAIGDAARSSVTFEEAAVMDYSSVISTLSRGLEARIQGDVDIDNATLEALLNSSESTRLEFKRAIGDRSEDIAREAVALANVEGGRIIYGVSNSGDPIGLTNIEEAEHRVSNLLKSSVNPNVVAGIHRHKVSGCDLLEVKVQRMTEIPASYSGIFYKRTGTTTGKLTGQEILQQFPRE